MDKIEVVVKINGNKIGKLSQVKHHDSIEFEFVYDIHYLERGDATPISYSLPLTTTIYKSKKLFPFFEGLVSEGWLQKMQSRTQRIDERDYFTMLIENGEDLIGAVSLAKEEK